MKGELARETVNCDTKTMYQLEPLTNKDTRWKGTFQKQSFREFHMKTSVFESLFNKVQ